MTTARNLASALCVTALLSLVIGCTKPPQTTLVGKFNATFIKTFGVGLNPPACGPSTPPRPDFRALYNNLPAANKLFPFAGFELWRSSVTGCTASTLDSYRGLVTFNMAAVSNLKGLVQKAELIVETQALPSGAGGASTLVVPVTAVCTAALGGAAALQRFGPAAAAALPQLGSNTNASLIELAPPDPFPAGTTVYTFPASLVPGPVAGATNPTTLTANGTGGAVFVTDVTGQVNAALNGNFAGMSWMLTSLMEPPLPGAVRVGGNLDCKTSYDIRLKLTHL